MKKTQKKLIGLLGLVFVVAMTIFAAFLPVPKVSAASSVTDTVVVRVINESQPPSASISNPDSGDKYLSPDFNIKVDYVNLKSYKIILTYTDTDGTSSPITVVENNDPGPLGPVDYDFRSIIDSNGLGYGKYQLKLEAIGDDDSAINDTVEFEYVAINAGVSTDDETGSTFVDLEYFQDQDGLTEDLKIDHIVLNVYDKDGVLVEVMSPIIVKMPAKRAEIVFPDGVPAGEYRIVAQPYNVAGKLLFEDVVMTISYDGKEIVVPATADTGGLFKNLNIAKSDYLVTGIGVFLVVGIGGIFFINKREKSSKRRK